MKTDAPLILASTSPYRRQLLERLRLPFEAVPPDVGEDPRPDEAPEDLVRRLSVLKARAVAGRLTRGLVIGSDQVALLDGRVLGKPGGRERAREQLAAASGKTVSFLTGLCVADAAGGGQREHLDRTVVRFRRLSDSQIERYLDAETPYDCAGSFKCEGLGISLFESVETRDPTALMGLPLIALCRLLREFGVPVP